MPITRAPTSRASWTAIEPTPPAAPWIRTVWPVVRRAWSNRPCHAVSPEIGSAAATVWSTSAGERGEVAGLHRGVLGQRAVAGPVGQSEHPLADGEAGGSVAELDDDTRQLVPGHARCPVAAGAVGPRCRPVELAGGEARGVDPHDDVVLGGVGVGQVGQGEPADAGVTVSDGDGSHVRSFPGCQGLGQGGQGIDDALDRGGAPEIGNEVLENIGVHGPVGRVRAVLEPVEVGAAGTRS